MLTRTTFCLLVSLLWFGDVVWTMPNPLSPQTEIHKLSIEERRELAIRQNEQADREGLVKIKNDKQLARLVKDGTLAPLPHNLFVRVDYRLPAQYRYCLPWTRSFLDDLGLAHAFQTGFTDPVQVNSAVRSVPRQRVIAKINSNAVETTGPRRSSHLTGSTVDIAKKGDINWIREYLTKKMQEGELIFVEEFNQLVFHVMVFKNYGKKGVVSTQ
ncbi:MAG: hypothetical protein UU11_C0003G0016 [Parcubacteria group bacterium GW2011_GWF2_40_69]|nr:MAG: hypothetical protein UT25_C0004G0034 [Parcubacteria group bacterium GW2011_GWC1_39_12]KKR19114.1 MAG: hypothetical protein UT49_C0003G0034 [Parcubacteria group bacterium GW2011_GWF1_39_37]KKR34969.1 MAG: hypothetical protein UT68_C0006G0016 [Parcubacteria group bacterium GW2011_GWC2_40_10]KKR51877.1 MAG: hypothetical protein UT89_C0005G0034 [Parcubacteria group bacterium GW2011_GWE1_40_20]KKR66177.1 MAG: hypothetical protein UU06_C0004G0009 [Parcubacteria group bacterium GW2011_GWB1_40_